MKYLMILFFPVFAFSQNEEVGITSAVPINGDLQVSEISNVGDLNKNEQESTTSEITFHPVVKAKSDYQSLKRTKEFDRKRKNTKSQNNDEKGS